jgi:Glycoside-hydrolase family GH114/Fibronectin type III domain
VSRALRAVILAALVTLCCAVAPAAAQAWYPIVTPNQVEAFGYGTGTGHTTTGNSPWTYVSVTANDGARRTINQSNINPGLNGWVKQWDDGSALGATEQVDTWSDLRVRFAYGTSGKAVGTYASTWRFTNSNASPSTVDVPLKAYVQPWNQCTDGLDNDGDGWRDWKKGAGGSSATADTDCLDMNDTTEGSGALTPPATPSNVSCTYGNAQIAVTWTDNANNETEQYVHTQTTSSGGLGQDIAVGANTTSKTVTTNMVNGVQFDSWVTATNAAGSGSSVQTSFCRGMPLAAPAGLDATAADTDTVNVTWGDITGETGYTLQRDTTSSFASPVDTTLAAGTTSYADNSVTGDGSRTYYYRVKPTRTAQATDVVSNVDSVVPPPPDTGVVPVSVATVNATADSSSAITVTWNDVSTETGYRVERDTDPGFANATTVTKAADSTSHQFAGLTENTQYYFRVRAFNAAGDSPAWSPTATATTPAAQTAPAAPSGLGLTVVNSTRIDAAWTDNSGNETKFEVQRDTSSGFTSPTTVDVAANGTTLISTGLAPSTQYYFRVRAVNDAGNSAYTATQTATTPATPAQCGDGVDNADPEDTLVDYPADPGCTSASDDDETDPPPTGGFPTRWMPTGSPTMYWQITGSYTSTAWNTRSGGVQVVDIDYQNSTATHVSTFLNADPDRRAVCYMSAGTAENFRPDYQAILDIDQARRNAGDSNGILGAVLPEWQDERWFDPQDFQYYKHIIQARIDTCKAKGFQAVEFDNMDGFTNDPATVTAAEQLTYNKELAKLAHENGLAVLLKNDIDQLSALQPYFDAALNEQCGEFSECGGYTVFRGNTNPANGGVAGGKAVWQAEYSGTAPGAAFCTNASAAGILAARYGLDLSDSTQFTKCNSGAGAALWSDNSKTQGTTTFHPSS